MSEYVIEDPFTTSPLSSKKDIATFRGVSLDHLSSFSSKVSAVADMILKDAIPARSDVVADVARQKE